MHTMWDDETEGKRIKIFSDEIVWLQADRMAFRIYWIVSVWVEDTDSDAILLFTTLYRSLNSNSHMSILTRYTNGVDFLTRIPHTLNHAWSLDGF